MKRLRLIALRSEREELLASLIHLGCVEVCEQEQRLNDPEWASLLSRDTSDVGDAKALTTAMSSAVETLQKYAPVKKFLFSKRKPVSEQEFLDPKLRQEAVDAASKINEYTQTLAQLQSQETRAAASRASLSPWASLDFPLEKTETESTRLNCITFPAATDLSLPEAALAEDAPLSQLIPASSDNELQYCLLVSHKDDYFQAMDCLKPFSVSQASFKDFTGSAQENIDEIDRQVEQDKQKQEEAVQNIISMADWRDRLEVTYDWANQELAKQIVCDQMLTDGTIIFLEGWVSTAKTDEGPSRIEQLETTLGQFTCAYDLTDPEEEDIPPTQLQNPKWMYGINMVTEMYSLPAYRGIDPNPLIFFWFVFFFGFMFADVAYGLIILAVSIAVTKIYHPKKTMGQMFQLGIWLGISTTVCGFFVGGFFGNALETIYENFVPGGVAAMPAWLTTFCDGIVVNPIADPMTVLIIALAFGCIHLIMGQCIHIYMGFRDGHGIDTLLDVVPWWIFFAGIVVLALGGGFVVLIVGLVVLICTQGRHSKTFMGKVGGGFKSIYDITSWLSDILSYARLMALMLATSVIAMVFNTLGALPSSMLFKTILFVLVFIIGHLFNIGVNIIGTYVHAARLQYLEYFDKFYEGDGIPFAPLAYDTKYVDIIDDENKKEEN